MADEMHGQVPAPVVLHDGDPGARRYADWLAEEFKTRTSHHDAADPGELVVAGTVVLITGMPAGGGLGGSAFIKENWEALVEAGRRVAVVMVGPTPVTDEARITLMSEEFSGDQLRDLKIFQLRGVVTPDQLGFRQRLGIKTALAALRRKPDRTPEEDAMVELGGLDLTDRLSLGPLLRWIRREA
ncbi:hypothetical protein [Dietzia alimentaria]|uniref:hypothetical protein n=1 Tax=Dietzia alimentaria TaxID=665550 RepID=UPI00029B2111|nr:hypothetical protein [Dietzia alimentaria]